MSALPARQYRYLDFLIDIFVVVLIVSGYLFKVVYEVVATPLTYWVVNTLKRREGVCFFDRNTNLNPFAIAAPAGAAGDKHAA